MSIVGVQNKGIVLEICVTPQNDDLTRTEFEALTYIDVCCATELPEFGQETEFLSEHCISGEEVTGIGAATGMETEVQYFYRAECTGQDFLRNNVGGNSAYAVRKVYPDATTTTTATTIYTRVRIGGFNDGGGGVDDFVTHTSSWKIAQDPIFVKPGPV